MTAVTPRDDDGAAHFLDAVDTLIDRTAAEVKATVLAALRPLLCPTCAAHTRAAGAGDDTTEGEAQ